MDTAGSLMSVHFQLRRQFAVSDQVAQPMLNRHALGDWGDLSAEDIQANNAALRDGDRTLRAYEFGATGQLRRTRLLAQNVLVLRCGQWGELSGV